MFANPHGMRTLTEREQVDATLNPTIPLLTPTGDDPKHEQVQVEIENVVATADLSQYLNLETILEVTPGARYNPERFPGLVYKLKRPRTTTLLFASGKMVCTGAKTTRSAKRAIEQIINKLRDHGMVITGRPDTEIQNIVASGDLQGTIDLENVAERLFKTMYEPEQFPALIYRMSKPKVVFLIFANGKIVCTGAKTEADVNLGIEKLQDTLKLNKLITCNRSNEGSSTVLLNETPTIQQ
jgi:transcription initiation factor TFIID TATA-box-binding protein